MAWLTTNVTQMQINNAVSESNYTFLLLQKKISPSSMKQTIDSRSVFPQTCFSVMNFLIPTNAQLLPHLL